MAQIDREANCNCFKQLISTQFDIDDTLRKLPEVLVFELLRHEINEVFTNAKDRLRLEMLELCYEEIKSLEVK